MSLQYLIPVTLICIAALTAIVVVTLDSLRSHKYIISSNIDMQKQITHMREELNKVLNK